MTEPVPLSAEGDDAPWPMTAVCEHPGCGQAMHRRGVSPEWFHEGDGTESTRHAPPAQPLYTRDDTESEVTAAEMAVWLHPDLYTVDGAALYLYLGQLDPSLIVGYTLYEGDTT